MALLVPDKQALSELARTLGLAEQAPSQLLEHGAIRQLFEREIERVSAEFKSYERIRAFAFSPEAFSQQNGMLTPSLKLKRHEIVRRFGALLDELYPEAVHAPLPLEAEPRVTS